MENDQPSISAILIVRNEAKLLPRCLSSLAGVVQEIIVVHDGPCQDGSLEIAALGGARVVEAEYYGAMEFHFPMALALAVNDWILRIDADEFLSPELKKELPRLIVEPVSGKKIKAGFSFLWPLFDGQKIVSSHWPSKVALFRKSCLSFLGVPHFSLNLAGPIEKTALILNHQPDYDNLSQQIFRKKQLAWAELQAATYLKPFSEIAKFNYSAPGWPLAVRWRLRCPLALLPADFSVTFLKNIFSSAYRAGWAGLKASCRAASYRTAIDYYIFKLKNND